MIMLLTPSAVNILPGLGDAHSGLELGTQEFPHFYSVPLGPWEPETCLGGAEVVLEQGPLWFYACAVEEQL